MKSINESAETEVKTEIESLGQLLIREEHIVQQDLEFALEHQRYSKALLGEILVKMGALDRSVLERTLSLQQNNNIDD